MNTKKKTIALLLMSVFAILVLSSVSLAASIVKIGKSVRMKELKKDIVYSVDLDGNGKAEKLEIVDDLNWGGGVRVKINGKKVLTVSWDYVEVTLYDISKKDKTKELLFSWSEDNDNYETEMGGIYVYRYTGKKLKKIATSKFFNGIKTKITKAGFAHDRGFVKPTGNGRIIMESWVRSSKWKDQEFLFNLSYKIKNGKLVLDQEANHKGNNGWASFDKFPIKIDLVAFKNPTLDNNKKLFTVSKGTDLKEIKIMKMRIGNDLAAIQIKYDGNKGWVFFKTNTLMVE